MNFDNLLDKALRKGHILTMLALAVCVIAARPLSRSEDNWGVRTQSIVALAAPVQLISTGTGGFWADWVNDRNEVCIHNANADPTQKVTISSWSTTDQTNSGWTIFGTAKECHDWGGNIPLYVYAGSANTSKVEVLISR